MDKQLLVTVLQAALAAAEGYEDNGGATATPAKAGGAKSAGAKAGKAAGKAKSNITQESLKEKLTKIIKEQGRETAVGLLQELGADKLSEVNESDYAALDKRADEVLAGGATEDDEI